ncbi:MAG: DUF2905 domain-containing protein [Candidatus Omnitrophica bacterium]|nr:DUF2905 domain-containing protein [Candidatus Omnitrophota bacterium]
MQEIAKMLLSVGVVCILAAGVLMVLSKIPGIGKLPGDIIIKKENFTFYFPIATCVLLSFLVSLILFLINKR